MRRTAGILLVAACLAGTPGTADAAEPATTSAHTAAGMKAAARAVLLRGDLGAGWAVGSAGAQEQSVGCGGEAPGAGVVETGRAVSKTFSQGASGPFVSQVVVVYATALQAQLVWRHTVGKAALRCLAASVAGGSVKGVRFTVEHELTLPRPLAGTRSAAYRVVASAHAKLQTVSAYVDLVVLGRGNTLTEINFAGFSQPLDRTLELAVARALARRL